MTGARNIKSEFNPSIVHPFYFTRKGIYNAVKKNAGFLTGKMIDLGCGSKPYRDLINCNEYVGVDFENPGHPHENEQIDVYYDGKRIPFPDNTFDSALCTEVFEHIFNLPEIIEELSRVLKQDGVLFVTCPFVWKEHELPHDYARYTLFALDDMLQKGGFKKVVSEKTGNFIEVIYQMVVLFFYDKFYPKIRRWTLVRIPFKFFFIILPNFTGSLLSHLAKKDDQMYLNNVVIYRKC